MTVAFVHFDGTDAIRVRGADTAADYLDRLVTDVQGRSIARG